MARTHFEKYNSATTSNKVVEKPLIPNTNDMTNKNKKSSGSSSSTHESMDGRSKVATSMRKFIEDDDDFDYLGNITSIPKHSNSTRNRTPTSYRKKNMRANIPNGRTPPRTNSGSSSGPKSIRNKSKSKLGSKTSSRDVYEGNLNDTKISDSAKNLMGSARKLGGSARKLVAKAARAVSPGRLRARSKSPGPQKIRNRVRSKSPNSAKTEQLTDSPPSPTSKKKSRSKSPGRLKKRDSSEERPKSPGRLKRSESPGRLKKSSRSHSAGRLKKRSQSPGALRKSARSRRRPDNGDDDGGKGRSNSRGPMKRPERARSHDRHKPRSRRGGDGTPIKPSRSTRSTRSTDGEAPLKKEQSYSNMQDELNRYKVKRNKSMDNSMATRARRDASKLDNDDDRGPPRRAESMMLSREMGRRGKSNSLADLVQYKEEEIHSTSYFASNHVLINRERMKRGLRPLTRNVAMDQLARKSAESMAESSGLKPLPTTYVGNVLRGDTIRSIHRSTMLQKQGRERANILNPYFQDFGVGTCKGEDGLLYMCQLFSERLELELTDTKDADDDVSD